MTITFWFNITDGSLDQWNNTQAVRGIMYHSGSRYLVRDNGRWKVNLENVSLIYE
jgi:hypothetical protein